MDETGKAWFKIILSENRRFGRLVSVFLPRTEQKVGIIKHFANENSERFMVRGLGVRKETKLLDFSC